MFQAVDSAAAIKVKQSQSEGAIVSNDFLVGAVKSFVKIGVLCVFLALAGARAFADPVGVSYTVTGSSGAWILDFSVTNNLNAGQDVYLFGVLLPAQDITNNPADYQNCLNGCTQTTFNPSGDGGPNLTYNNLWHIIPGNNLANAITFGTTLSGFEAEVTSLTAPTSVDWFAYGLDATANGTAPYIGGGNFNAGLNIAGFVSPEENPGFDGVAGVVTAPEPSALLFLAAGLIALVGLSRRRISV